VLLLLPAAGWLAGWVTTAGAVAGYADPDKLANLAHAFTQITLAGGIKCARMWLATKAAAEQGLATEGRSWFWYSQLWHNLKPA
jgi:hypothetical protein